MSRHIHKIFGSLWCEFNMSRLGFYKYFDFSLNTSYPSNLFLRHANAYLKSHFTTLLDIALSFGKRLIALAGIFKITVLSILKLVKRQTRYLRIIPPYLYETR